MSLKSTIRFFAFFSINLVSLYFAHSFIYQTTVKYLDITDPVVKSLIISIISGLSGLFIISIILGHIINNNLIKRLYYLSAVWLGIFMNLLFLFLINRLIVVIFHTFDINVNYSLLHIIILIIALSISIYSLINAKFLRLKEISVRINELPDYWKDKKVVFISDVHLGAIYGKSFLGRLIEKIKKIKPELIIIGGDLFDGTKGDYEDFTDQLNSLNSTNEVLMIIGNHESYMHENILTAITNNLKFKMLDNSVLNVHGLQIGGLNPYSVDRKKNLKKFADSINSKLPLILINHEPSNISFARRAGADLMLSGHTHKGQFFPFNLITRLIYRKMNYGLNKEKVFQSYTSSGAGTWGPPMRNFSNSEIVVIKLENGE